MTEEIEAGGAGPQIENADDFAKWLAEVRPAPDVCVALAARAALRALPLITQIKTLNSITKTHIIPSVASCVFRAAAISLLSAKYSRLNHYKYLSNSAINSALKLATSAEYSSYNLLWSAFNAANASTIIYSRSENHGLLDQSFTLDRTSLSGDEPQESEIFNFTNRAIGDAVMDFSSDSQIFEFWVELEKDMSILSLGGSVKKITDRPLWDILPPNFISNYWITLADALPDTNNWQVWKNWYEDILNGKIHSKAHDMIYATVPEEEWEKGPAAANAWIAAKLAELDAKTSTTSLTDPADIVAQENQATHEKDGPIDFFISYEKEDIGFARFVDSILRKAGYRVFVQFRDMPTGSDFLVEMNKGLSQSSRFISILSPRYNKSKMCQAEWNAAYHADPDGEKRKIVQYLIEATDLLPLARSRVYKSLVGLSQTQATVAILDAVGSNVSVDTDVRWPGAEALDHMSQATKLLFDVALDDKRQLAPVANHSLHQDTERLYGFSAESLYMDMREAIQDYAEYVCDTREGNFAFSSSIQRTARKLLEKTHEDWKKSNPLAINRALIHTLMALENADRNGDLPSGYINYHQNELRGMHQRLITIFPNLEQFREKARFERYLEPEPKALEAQTDILLKTSQDSTVTSPKLAHILRESQESLDELRELLLPETAKETRRKDLYEEHKSIATQIVPVWNWIVNAGAKIGKTGDDMSKTIENFEKLSKRIDNAKDYFDWLSKWFY